MGKRYPQSKAKYNKDYKMKQTTLERLNRQSHNCYLKHTKYLLL